jgi:hypothetical protein
MGTRGDCAGLGGLFLVLGVMMGWSADIFPVGRQYVVPFALFCGLLGAVMLSVALFSRNFYGLTHGFVEQVEYRFPTPLILVSPVFGFGCYPVLDAQGAVAMSAGRTIVTIRSDVVEDRTGQIVLRGDAREQFPLRSYYQRTAA